MIEHYRFGRFMFQGAPYTSDAIVFQGCVQPWRRKRGHRVAREDLEALLGQAPEAIVIGTGAYGMMKVPKETRCVIEEAGIQLVAQKTAKAVETFNQLCVEGVDAALAMHLTC